MRIRRFSTRVAMAFFAVLFVFAMGAPTLSAAPGDNGNGGGGGKPTEPPGKPDKPGKPDQPGKPDVPGRGKGGLYGDLRIVLRAESGLPMLDGFECEQPITETPIAGVSPVENPVDGSPVYLIPLVGEEGEEDGTQCDVQLAYADYVEEVEFGRLNLGRSPEKVLARQLADATATLTGVSVTLDHAGRLVADGSTIDSPGQNLAIHQELQERGQLIGTDGLPILLPSYNDFDFLDHASAALGAAADKTGQVTPDLIVYNNRILGTPAGTDVLPTITGGGGVGVDGELYVDYSDYSYTRSTTYPGCVSGFEINPDGTPGATIAGTVIDRVFGGSDFSDDNILAVAQRADDARAVIEYIHETTTHVITFADLVGTTSCPPTS